MESSPLTRQSRPDSFQPKIVKLYRDLFDVSENAVLSEGFWREFFLLSPDKQHFRQVLDPLSADDILHLQDRTQMFFARATSEIRGGVEPRDQHALENLTAFLGAALCKRYTNPSSDVISILAGLDRVDELVSELVDGIHDLVRNANNVDLRSKAIETALVLTSVAYSTGLISYFTHCDLFPALMKVVVSTRISDLQVTLLQYISDSDDPSLCFKPMLLLGLLANYNKFEFQNPYHNRLEDFVNERTMQSLVRGIGHVCCEIRSNYIAVQDDTVEGWNLSSTLAYVGLQKLTSESKRRKAAPSEEDMKRLFDQLPPAEASISLPIYSFVYANKLFASNLISLTAEKSNESPFSAFLSLTSYLSHHAFRSPRGLHYSVLSLLTIRALVEDTVSLKRLASEEVKTTVRLCRQRAPHPPLVTTDRVPVAAILDICADTISHNLRRRLDVPLYNLALVIILRICSHLSHNKIRLSYHWSYLWGTLLSLLRFLTQYATDMTQNLPSVQTEICTPLADLIAFSLSSGDTFLPDPASYDDLFYKIVETGAELLTKFRSAYYSQQPTSNPKSGTVTATGAISPSSTNHISSSITILIQVSTHYQDLLQAQTKTSSGRKTHQSPAAVQKIIKQGHETLNIEAGDELGRGGETWREGSGGWKGELKKIIRTVVGDAREVVW